MVNSLHEDAVQIQMMSDDPSLLCQTVGDPSSLNVKVLNFLFLGCEPNMPYGPIEHTAQIMMDLLAQALTEATVGSSGGGGGSGSSNSSSAIPREGDTPVSSSNNDTCWMLRMKLYNVQEQEYPSSIQEWNSYDGIILPGSFSAAYDEEPWIRRLCDVIQTEIVPKRRKTLGESCALALKMITFRSLFLTLVRNICLRKQVFALGISKSYSPKLTVIAFGYV